MGNPGSSFTAVPAVNALGWGEGGGGHEESTGLVDLENKKRDFRLARKPQKKEHFIALRLNLSGFLVRLNFNLEY